MAYYNNKTVVVELILKIIIYWSFPVAFIR